MVARVVEANARLGVGWRGLEPDADAAREVLTVLTIKEVAAVLRRAERTVYAMAQVGEIPAFKIRGQWRVRRAELDQWARPGGQL
jgi:excisionase family DNA binding protein